MKKLFSLILGLLLFSFSNVYAAIYAEISDIYSTKLIENSGVITYTFDVKISSEKSKLGDYVKFNLCKSNNNNEDSYSFRNTQIEIIEGTRKGALEVAFPMKEENLSDIKVRIKGNISVEYLSNNSKDMRIDIGTINENGEKVFGLLTKDLFRHSNVLKVKVSQHMNLGKAYPGGILNTTNTSFGGKPAKINIELVNRHDDDDEKLTLTIQDNGKVKLYGDGKPMTADVWFRDEKNNNNRPKEITKKLTRNNKTEEIILDGISSVPEGQPKGIYKGIIRVRVKYEEDD